MHKLSKDGLLKDMFRKHGEPVADSTDRKYSEYLPSEDEEVGAFDPKGQEEFAHWSDEEVESSSSYAWMNDEDDLDITSAPPSSITSDSYSEGADVLFGARRKKKKSQGAPSDDIYNGAQLLCPDDSFSDCAFVFAK